MPGTTTSWAWRPSQYSVSSQPPSQKSSPTQPWQTGEAVFNKHLGSRSYITMIVRLAAMLNYFLKTLTGPDRKSCTLTAVLYRSTPNARLAADINYRRT